MTFRSDGGMSKQTNKTYKMRYSEFYGTYGDKGFFSALQLALYGALLAAVKAVQSVNRFVHRWPWLVIFMVVAASVAVSFGMIGAARVERDQASAQSYRYEQTLDSLSVAMELHGMKYKRQ